MLTIQSMDHGIKMFSLLNKQKLDHFMFNTLFYDMKEKKRDLSKSQIFVWVFYSFTSIQEIQNNFFT